MIEARPISSDEIYDVNLDALTTEELLAERAEIAARIPMITAQLQDKDRRPPGPEDDGPAWDAFRDWRRRARWALAHHKRELVEIKQSLTERRDTSTAARQRRLEQGQPTEHDLAQQERGRQLRVALENQTDEALLLRAYRVLRHLLPDGCELPETLDTDDRDALSMVSIRLRRAFGTGHLRAFVLEDPS